MACASELVKKANIVPLPKLGALTLPGPYSSPVAIYIAVPSECAFSTAGNIVTDKRACLNGDLVNMLCFLHENLKLPF